MSDITQTHPDFQEAEASWDEMEAFCSGEKAVKDAGKKYLPPLAGQSIEAYNSYVMRAFFYNAAGRTVTSLVGSVFRKKPTFVVPEKMQYLLTDATGKGTSLAEVCIKLVTEQMITARSGLLVDREGTGLPYLVVYDADDLRNWSDEFIVLEEDFLEADPKDKYKLVEKEQYRELTYDDNGNYIVNIYREIKQKGSKASWQIAETIRPTRAGRPMTYIPFNVITPDGLDWSIVKEPLRDLVDIQHKHYMLSADYANALHILGHPTPYVTGVEKTDGMAFNVGGGEAWVLPDAQSKIGFLEFTGQGLQPLESGLTKLEGMMGALGARIITPAKTTNGSADTAEGVKSREAVAMSVLSSIITSVETAVTNALVAIADWEQLPTDNIKVVLNRDLIQTPMDANMLNALTTSLQKGTISPELFYSRLEDAGMTPDDSSFELEQQRIADYVEMVTASQLPPTQPAAQQPQTQETNQNIQQNA